jgi:hypothetical protein
MRAFGAQSGRTPMRLRKLSANKRHRVAFGIRFKANYFGHSEFGVETSRVGSAGSQAAG